MPEETQLSLHSESAFDFLCKKFREYRFAILGALLTGLLCYLFMFTNKLPNHDDLTNLFDVGATVKSGRWGLALLSLGIPDFSMPWFHGIVTLLLLSVSMAMVAGIFEIRSPMLQLLMASAVVAFPSLGATFSYMYTSSYYAVAFLLAVSTVALLKRDTLIHTAAAVLTFILAVSIYQAYLAITVSLMVVLLLQQTLYTEKPLRAIFLRGLGWVLFLGMSLGLYWVLTGLIQQISGIDMGGYAHDAMEESGSILERVRLCYSYAWRVLTDSSKELIPEGFSRNLHCLLAVFALCELLGGVVYRRCWKRLPLLVFLLVIFPMSLTCIYLLVSRGSVHSLVLYSYSMIYVFLAVVAQGSRGILSGKPVLDQLRGWLHDGAVALLTLVICFNIFLANVMSFQLFFCYENNYAIATSLITQVQMYPGYNHEVPIAIIGRLPRSESLDEFSLVRGITGIKGFHTESWRYEKFWEDYCGFDVRFVRDRTKRELEESEEFRDMPTYPEQGFIRMIDDSLVIKLPEHD